MIDGYWNLEGRSDIFFKGKEFVIWRSVCYLSDFFFFNVEELFYFFIWFDMKIESNSLWF